MERTLKIESCLVDLSVTSSHDTSVRIIQETMMKLEASYQLKHTELSIQSSSSVDELISTAYKYSIKVQIMILLSIFSMCCFHVTSSCCTWSKFWFRIVNEKAYSALWRTAGVVVFPIVDDSDLIVQVFCLISGCKRRWVGFFPTALSCCKVMCD